MVIVIFGLVILTLLALLLSIFFQLVKLDKALSETVETVEVYLLHVFGEIRDNVVEADPDEL